MTIHWNLNSHKIELEIFRWIALFDLTLLYIPDIFDQNNSKIAKFRNINSQYRLRNLRNSWFVCKVVVLDNQISCSHFVYWIGNVNDRQWKAAGDSYECIIFAEKCACSRLIRAGATSHLVWESKSFEYIRKKSVRHVVKIVVHLS